MRYPGADFERPNEELPVVSPKHLALGTESEVQRVDLFGNGIVSEVPLVREQRGDCEMSQSVGQRMGRVVMKSQPFQLLIHEVRNGSACRRRIHGHRVYALCLGLQGREEPSEVSVAGARAGKLLTTLKLGERFVRDAD